MAAELKSAHRGRRQSGWPLFREEAKAGMPYVLKHFDQIDTAKKGSVSMAEIAAFFRARGAARKAGS